MDKRLWKNILYQGLYQGLVVFYPILTTPLISKAFGSDVLGIYSFTYSIAYYFSIIAGLGIHTHGSRIIAINRENEKILCKQFKSLYSIQFFFSSCVLAVYVVFVLFFSDSYKETQLLQGLLIVAAMIDISWFLSGLERFKVMTLRNAAIKLCSLGLIYLLIHTKEDLNKYVLIVAGTNCLGQLSVWPVAVRFFRYKSIKLDDIKGHIIPVCKLFLPVLALNSYVLIDKVVLGIFRTINEVGYYENCDRLIRMPVGLSSAICAVVFPRAAYYVSKGENAKNDQLIMSMLRYNYIIGIPVILGLQGMASGIVPWYMGNDFLPCISYLCLLAPIIFFMITNYILRLQYFVALKRDKEYIHSILIAVMINIILNLMLVGKYGVYGVIIGSLCSEITASGYLWKKSKDELNYKALLPDIKRCLIFSIIMVIVIRVIGNHIPAGFWTSLVQIVIGIIIYGGLSLGTKWIWRNRVKC